MLLALHVSIAAVPVVSTDSIILITASSATVYGNVTSDGGFPVSERGIVYSHTISNPVIGNSNVVTSGYGTGPFSGYLSNLTPNYTYYTRAYAINLDGTAYGDVMVFTTGSISTLTEGNGIINKVNGATNSNGAMVFNGTEWVVNSTWAHRYFIDNTTGERLKEVETYQVPPNGTDSVFSILRYNIERFDYSYTFPAKDSGEYMFVAIAYQITDTITGKEVVLRTRGTGNGTSSSYFNIYIQDDVTSGIPSLITALRNDPFWFSYRGVDMDFALQQSSPTDSLTGEFPTLNGWYFLDVNNGGDMGGKSFHFHTSDLDSTASNIADLGSSYPIDFAIRYMDDYGDIKELAFTPLLLSEVYFPNTNVGELPVDQKLQFRIFPNPVRSTSIITYYLSEKAEVSLCIYDETGKEQAKLVNGFNTAGLHQMIFSPRILGITTGTYLCRFCYCNKTEVLKIIIIE